MSKNSPDQDRSLEETIEEMESQLDVSSAEVDSESSSHSQQADTPEQLVALLESQVSEHRKRELQAQAELENFRKRMIRDNEQQLRYANLPLVRDLLDVVDNLSRAIQASSKDNATEKSALLEGVTLVHQQLMNVFKKYNCHPIESLGKEFDPNFHEAISQAPSNEYPSGTVMYVAAEGYKMYDRVVRPSQVIVSTGS